MRLIPSFLLPIARHCIRFWGPALFIIAAGILIEAPAQSGRRAARQPTTSPTPTLDPGESVNAKPTETAAMERPAQRMRMLFARQPTSRHLPTEDVIAASFFKRLSEYADVDCESIGDLKQSQASTRAKSEKVAWVVLLKFDINSYQSGTVIPNSEDLEVEYFALAPGTAKKQAKGKLYFQTIGSGRLQRSEWPNGAPVKITPEAAGIEAAETLYQLLQIKPTLKPLP